MSISTPIAINPSPVSQLIQKLPQIGLLSSGNHLAMSSSFVALKATSRFKTGSNSVKKVNDTGDK